MFNPSGWLQKHLDTVLAELESRKPEHRLNLLCREPIWKNDFSTGPMCGNVIYGKGTRCPEHEKLVGSRT